MIASKGHFLDPFMENLGMAVSQKKKTGDSGVYGKNIAGFLSGRKSLSDINLAEKSSGEGGMSVSKTSGDKMSESGTSEKKKKRLSTTTDIFLTSSTGLSFAGSEPLASARLR